MATDPVRLGTTQHAKPPPGAKKGAGPAVKVGNAYVTIPTLTGIVGRSPAMNAAADVALVNASFAHLTALQNIPGQTGAPLANILAVAMAVRGYQADLGGAIEAFQRLEDIRDADGQRGFVHPGSLTWETLFTYGELARELNATRDAKVNPADYIHTGGFDNAVFEAEATRLFDAKADPDEGRYNSRSIAGMLDLLGRCARDPRIIDIRWIAYILATTMWESYKLSSVPKANGKGTTKVGAWGSPIEESGKGKLNASDIKRYYLAVKVLRNADGTATVTEQDGDVFTVSTAGVITKGNPAKRGSDAFAAATPAYAAAAGTEHAYFGRGYCQLTWWDNYASTGAEIGLGLELLFNPDRALEPDVAFEVMVHCMVYGLGFANRHRLQHYLSGAKTDYVGARAMVNGTNENQKIAAVARVFEAALLKARR